MLLVGLTGGIGSGKSTVAGLLAAHGAVVLDADAFAREAVAAGSAGFASVVRRFGAEVVGPDGELDRPRLAAIVFGDEAARRDLEGIVHPFVRRAIADGITANAASDRVVVLVNPLLIEMGTHRDCDVVIVVSVRPETQVDRSVAVGMDEADVRSRMDAQLPFDERARHADIVLDNEGSREELAQRVDELWDELAARVAGAAGASGA
jgi:dephospho-CoA kinase